MRRVLIALIVMVAACGQPPAQAGTSLVAENPTPSATATAAASPSPASSPIPSSKTTPLPSPKASPALLFAVLEAKGTANAWTYNTVAIAGLDGYARAKTTFIPMPVPTVGCMGSILPQSAHVAAGRVYFADGKGVVRSLSPQGQITQVVTFPLVSGQQMLSFAVSPDGSRLLGTVFTLPAKPNLGCNGSPAPGYALDVYSAPAGGPSTLLYHQTFQSSPSNVMALTGWDAVGPVGTSPTVWASQGGGPGSELGVAVRIDAGTGKVLRQVADPSSCLVWDSVKSGAFVCTLDSVPASTDPWGPVSQPVSIRTAAGLVEWHFTVTSVNGAWSPYLAPDEQHVVICCNFATSSNWLVERHGKQTLFKTGFYASGWLDATTVFGFSAQSGTSRGMLSYVALNSPSTFVSMGFSGSVVGTVRD
jgi:hypothetical protein